MAAAGSRRACDGPTGWNPSHGRSTRPRSTSCRAPWTEVDWNAELVRGDLATAVQQLKREPGDGLFVGGVKLPLALAELGLIDEYEFVVHPRLAGHGPSLFAGLSRHVDLRLVKPAGVRLGGGGDAV